jgi:hypothetical protein
VISIREGDGDTRPTRPLTWATRPPTRHCRRLVVRVEDPLTAIGADELRTRYNLFRLGVAL